MEPECGKKLFAKILNEFFLNLVGRFVLHNQVLGRITGFYNPAETDEVITNYPQNELSRRITLET